MIFVTVGTQLAFDRMVSAVDAWAAESGEDVFAQVGPSERSFSHICQQAFLEPVDFDRSFEEASLVIAHAGMGSILSALSYGKPIIIMPRKAALGEHRNDHQMATAKRFSMHQAVNVAWDEGELHSLLEKLPKDQHSVQASISCQAPQSFLTALRELIGPVTPE